MTRRIGLWAAAAVAIGACGVPAVAFAADMPVKAEPRIAAAAAPNWTGFYLKGGGGYGMWAADTTTIDTTNGACNICLPIRQGGRGWFGTVGGGFDYQLNSNIVIGAFADYDFASLKGSIQDQLAGSVADSELNWAWAVGARAGWLITPSILAYVTGGYTRAHFNGQAIRADDTGLSFGRSYRGVTTSGWFLGGGAETMLLPGWYWRNEYRLARYDVRDFLACRDDGTVCGTLGASESVRFRPYVQTVRSEIVYKFNWGAPTVGTAPAIANLPVKAPRAAAPAPIVNWTGLYLAGGGGYGMWAADTTTHDDSNGFECGVCVPIRQGGRGGFVSAGGGFDYQVSPAIVVGAFADYDFASVKGSVLGDRGFPDLVAQTKLDWAWYVGGRAGWVVAPQILTYVNAGYTRAHFTGNRIVSSFDGLPNIPDSTYRGFTVSGWFVGGGVEAQVWRSWFWRNEYRYARYGAETLVPCRVDGGGCGILVTNLDALRFQPTVQTVRSEVVYKFNWGGPVVARY